MAVLQPLFQQNDTTDQQAVITRLLIRDLLGDTYGIVQEGAFEVIQRRAGANNSVDVKAGSVVIPGTESTTQGYYFVTNDGIVNVPLPSPSHDTLTRLDTIIVKIRDSAYPTYPENNDCVIEWITGTPGSTSPPDLDALGYENYFRLANILVPPSFSNDIITSGNITDLRTSLSITPRGGAATVLGGPITCTSTTRPLSPRKGQTIWESDTKYIVVNEGTASSPSWVPYADSGSGVIWQNYTPSFPLTGSRNKRYGRYFRLGNAIVGEAGFIIGSGGNLVGNMYCTLPVPMTSSVGTDVAYFGAGRGFNATGLLEGQYWSCAAEITRASPNKMVNFGTGGTGPWGTTIPFNWSDVPYGDNMYMLFVYEV